MPTASPHSANNRCVIGPGLPSLICRLSTWVTGSTHGLVLEKNQLRERLIAVFQLRAVNVLKIQRVHVAHRRANFDE